MTTTLFLTDTFPSCCWNIKCLLTPENSLESTEFVRTGFTTARRRAKEGLVSPQRLSYHLGLGDEGLFLRQVQRVGVVQVLVPEETNPPSSQRPAFVTVATGALLGVLPHVEQVGVEV